MHKYRAVPTTVNGHRFDSKGEAMRYQELWLLEQSQQIRGLSLQVKYPLIVNAVKIGDYVADFRYFDNQKKAWVIEDYKGVRTPVYRLKKKLMLALHQIEIFETGR